MGNEPIDKMNGGAGIREPRGNARGRKSGGAPVLTGRRMEFARYDTGYPEALRSIARPPERLCIIGDPQALEPGISIIGARKATPYGLGCARRFARIAASLGVNVVSGGALGCDSQAHRGALEAGGRTAVVFGGGCDCLYPVRNKALFQRVIDGGGAVVSERDWGEPPLPYMFRERNRIIAGLARATLVVEAGLPSGTFSTADEALAAGRDVLAVPGSITSPTSAGSNRLIAQGAYPVVDDDTFESAISTLFGTLRHEQAGKAPKPPEDPLLLALFANPMRIDELMAAGLAPNAASLQMSLALYEGQGLVERYPDGRYGPAENRITR